MTGEVRQNGRVGGRENIVVQVAGDGNTVVVGLAHLALTRYLTRRRIEPSESQVELLSPYTLSIEMVGRERELAALRSWLADERPILIRVMTGGAGRGKTRLALELVEEVLRKGWDTGFVTSGELRRFRAQQNLATWGWRRPTLLVVDYAAAHAGLLRDWFVELADNPASPECQLRVLLLERHAESGSGWWETAFGVGGSDAQAVRRLLDPPEPIMLLELNDPADRRRVLTAILARAGSTFQPPAAGADKGFDRRLVEITWGGEPLFLLMAGLSAARLGIDRVLALTPGELVAELARRELARVERIAAGRRADERLAGHMAAYVTLCQGLTRDSLEAAIAEEMAARRHGTAEPTIVAEALHDALPGSARGVEPVLPDLIGEQFLLLTLGPSRLTRMQSVATVDRAAKRTPTRVITTVIRTAQDYGFEDALPLVWLDHLAEEADENRLADIENALPTQTLVLGEQALMIAQRLVAQQRRRAAATRSEPVRAALAASLIRASLRSAKIGRANEALSVAQEAADTYRELAADQPDAFRADLAAALNNLVNLLRELGRQKEALIVAQEAVAIRRKLAVAQPEGSRPALAAALNNLGALLGDSGRRNEALAAAQEALTIRRELAAVRPDSFRPALAATLNNLGNLLSGLGRRPEALLAAHEAVEMLRELATARPDAFRLDLATALNNLGTRLSELGRQEEALVAASEAANIFRELAAARPDTFRPDLAMALNNLAVLLSELGRREEGLAAAQEAADVYRKLAATQPDIFRPDLAMALNNLGRVLSELGRREEGLSAAQEAVDIYREVAAALPDAFRPDLATALNNLGNLLRELGRREEALTVAQEVVAICRELVTTPSGAFLPAVAMALNNLAGLLSELGRRDEALAALREAAHARSELAEVQPEAFRRTRALVLNNLFALLDESECQQDI